MSICKVKKLLLMFSGEVYNYELLSRQECGEKACRNEPRIERMRNVSGNSYILQSRKKFILYFDFCQVHNITTILYKKLSDSSKSQPFANAFPISPASHT